MDTGFSERRDEPRWGGFDLSLAYYGDMIAHPGLCVGIAYAIPVDKAINFELGGELGGFIHPRNERVLFALAKCGIVWSPASHAWFGLSLGAGARYGSVDGALYGFASDGSSVRVNDPGYGGFLASAEIELGWRFGLLSAFIEPRASLEYPYNGAWLARGAIACGARISLGSSNAE